MMYNLKQNKETDCRHSVEAIKVSWVIMLNFHTIAGALKHLKVMMLLSKKRKGLNS